MARTPDTTRRTDRRRRSAAAVVGALLVGGVLAAAPAPSGSSALPATPAPAATTAPTSPGDPSGPDGPTAESLGLEVEAGFQGQALRNTWMPVRVRLAPRSLFVGEVRIATDRNIVERRDVEVAGGATKEFTFVVPAGTLAVRVQPQGSDEAVQVRPRVDGRPAGALVGASPSLQGAEGGGRALPAVELVPTGERTVWVTADPLLLERTHLVAGALSTMVVTPADLEALSDVGRGNLQRAVLDGLNLVVVAPPGAVATGLPWQPAEAVAGATAQAPATVTPSADAWVLDAATAGLAGDGDEGGDGAAAVAASVPAGLGRVVVTGMSPADGGAGTWQHLLAERDASFRLNGEHSTERGWIAQETLRAGGGLDVPSLGLLAAFALAYVVVVGPGNALLLRVLGRRELGWVTVPAITVAFVGLAAAVASGTQPGIGVAGGATTWVDGLGTDLTVTAVRAPSAGEHTVVLPGQDWQIDPTTSDFTGVATVVDRAGPDVRTSMRLESLQVGSVVAHRATDEAPPLSLSAVASGDEVAVEVVNTSTRTIEDAQVRVGGHHSPRRSLAPGESWTWSAPAATLRQLEVWRDVFQESRGPDGVLQSPDSFRALISGQALADRPGLAVVVGQDPTATTAVLANGEPVQDLGRVVAVVAPITGGSGDVTPVESTRTLLVGGFQEAWQPSPHAVEGELSAHLRYRLPARAAGRVDAVLTDLRRGQGQVQGAMGVPQPMPEPAPDEQGSCVTVETRNADGSTSGSSSCSDQPFEPPACPEEAIACDIGPDFWRFEFADGTTQSGQLDHAMDAPMPFEGQVMGNAADALEVYDHAAGRWERLRDVADDQGVLPADFVSPFGEVHVRVVGGLFPFDFSARGVGARLTEA